MNTQQNYVFKVRDLNSVLDFINEATEPTASWPEEQRTRADLDPYFVQGQDRIDKLGQTVAPVNFAQCFPVDGLEPQLYVDLDIRALLHETLKQRRDFPGNTVGPGGEADHQEDGAP